MSETVHVEDDSPQLRITQSLFDLVEADWNNACQFGDEIADDYDEEVGAYQDTLDMIGENTLTWYTENGLAISVTVTVEEILEEVDDEATETEVPDDGQH